MTGTAEYPANTRHARETARLIATVATSGRDR